MPLSFPSSPTVGQVSSQNGRTYVWTSLGTWELSGNVAGHKATHATGGSDAISPSDIGAAATTHTHAASDITSGVLGTARLGSGTANSTTFLRGDGAWQAPVASFATSASFPATGITGTYYLDSDRGRLFQWTGSQYAEMGPVSTYPATHAHSGTDITSGTIPDARLSANVPILPAFLLTTNVPTTAVDSGTRIGITTLNLVSGTVYYAFFTPAITVTVSQITMGCHTTAASGLTLARMGLFTYDETTATLVARTASDTTATLHCSPQHARYTLAVLTLQVAFRLLILCRLASDMESGLSALAPRPRRSQHLPRLRNGQH